MSLEGGPSKPYPRACPQDCRLGGYQHGRHGETLTRYVNNTTVGYWPDGTVISPAAMPTESIHNRGEIPDTICEPATPDFAPGGWVGPNPHQVNLVSPPAQTFGAEGTTNFSVCQKRGFKNVAAVLQWNGVFGYDYYGIDTFCSCDVGAPYGYASYRSSPYATKYRTLAITVTAERTGGTYSDCETYDVTQTATSSATVAADSGVITGSRSAPWFCDDFSAGQYDEDVTTSQLPNGLPSSIVTLLDRIISVGIKSPEGVAEGLPIAGSTLTCTADGWACAWDSDGSVFATASWGSGGADFYNYGSWDNSCGDISGAGESSGTVYHEYLTYSATTMEWGWETVGDGAVTASMTVTGALSDANDAADIYADLTGNLLATIPLNDDQQYPWRTDSLCQVAPLVSRNQVQSNVPPGIFFDPVINYADPQTDCLGRTEADGDFWQPTYSWSQGVDANAGQFDGAILGALQPAGYEDFFCWQFPDYQGCVGTYDDGSGETYFDWYIYGYGMTVSTYNSQVGAQLPKTCTQWTDNKEVITAPPGASLRYADQTSNCQNSACNNEAGVNYPSRSDALWGYKYATIKERWSAQNYYIGGAMKFWYDETKVCGATNLAGSGAGSTWTLTDSTGTTLSTDPGVGTGDWGGSSVGGFYSGSTFLAGVVTLGALAYHVPSDWVSRSGDAALCFGPLRWPANPALMGRAACAATGLTGSVYGFAWANNQTHFGMAAAGTEQVDIYGPGMSALATNITATRTADGTFTTAANYPTAAWITIHGAPAWYMDSSYPRGTFVGLEWGFDNRTNGENARLTGAGCGGTTPPGTNTGYNGFTQAQGCEPGVNCRPIVLAVTPNSETWPGSPAPIAFPGVFALDEDYGSRWQATWQTTMTEVYYQTPHPPITAPDSLPIVWTMDDGTCQEDAPILNSDGAEVALRKFYPMVPLVEAEITLPAYGMATPQTETPTLPSGITLGWLSPVTDTMGDVSYPPGLSFSDSPGSGGFTADGLPAAYGTEWATRLTLEAAIAPDSTCGFLSDYLQWVLP